MKIHDTTKRTVRLELTFDDLMEYFIEKTRMLNIYDSQITLTTFSGDRPLNSEISGIAITAENAGEE